MKKTIYKIPMEVLLDLLINTYEKGFNYFDLELEKDPQDIQDKITILVRDEYHDSFKDKDESVPTKITDDNINNLL